MKNILSVIKSVLLVEFREGEMIPVRNPWLYGFAWNKFADNSRRESIIAMPIPLNLIAKVVRGAWGRMRYPARWMWFGDESAAYAAGRSDGMRGRITDEDIKTFLLRQKINEANNPQKLNVDQLQDRLSAYHRHIINDLDKSMSAMSTYTGKSKMTPFNPKVDWDVIDKT